MNVTDFLIAARDEILDPEHWAKGTFGRDKEGQPLSALLLEQAHSVCSMGALFKTSSKNPNATLLEPFRFLDKAFREAGCQSIEDGNDDNDHQFALDRFDDAIRLSKQ